jgi:hypothetical protein
MAWIQHRYGINLPKYGIGTVGMRLEQQKQKPWEKIRVRIYIREDILYAPLVLVIFPKKSYYLEER